MYGASPLGFGSQYIDATVLSACGYYYYFSFYNNIQLFFYLPLLTFHRMVAQTKEYKKLETHYQDRERMEERTRT